MTFNPNNSEGSSILQEERKILREYSKEIIEAMFFVAGRPLSVRKLSEEFGTDSREIRKIVQQLSKFLKENHGELQLSKLEYDTDMWIMHSLIPEHHIDIIRTILADDIPRLAISDPLTRQIISVISIYQPVSKAKIWKVLNKYIKSNFSIEILEEKLTDLQKEGLISLHPNPSPLQFVVTPLLVSIFGLESTKIKLRNQMVRYLKIEDGSVIQKIEENEMNDESENEKESEADYKQIDEKTEENETNEEQSN
ncbi:MAG: hypothetical protein HeimC3_27380 [Candidatus Heimdallarchaeota archaeon LC_3]|nr:MAG: hypothetical protein HeimC3_27380 [Candidatus Heimdallarchaeota archaeon LC_3]